MIVKSNQKDVIKSGIYEAKLAKVTKIKSGYGERLAFIFEIIEGKYNGLKLIRTCTPILKPTTNLNGIVQCLNRAPLTPEQIYQGIELEQFQGNEYKITVTQRLGKNGFYYSHIEQIQ